MLGEIVGSHEVREVSSKLVMGFVVEALDGRILDGAVHPLDLAIGPGMLGLVMRSGVPSVRRMLSRVMVFAGSQARAAKTLTQLLHAAFKGMGVASLSAVDAMSCPH